MTAAKYILAAALLCLCVSCRNAPPPDGWSAAVDTLNREAFDLRYKDIELSKAKATEALALIEAHTPDNYAARAKAWNHIAYAHFLTSRFDSTRLFLHKVRDIEPEYENRQIEEAITYITEARLFLRECKYAEAFSIYDSTLTLFRGGFNRLRYNDVLPLKKYDHGRYHWARSDYLIGNAVLGYYYRDTELPVILKSLDEIRNNPKLHVDTTQLSVLYYTYAGTYEKAIPANIDNFYKAFENIKPGLDLLADPASRNDFHLANFYQITGTILLNDGTRHWLTGADSTRMKAYLDDFNRKYLSEKYHWTAAEVESPTLPLLLLERADSIFRRYDDPYQNLASTLHIGNYHLAQGDTVRAWSCYERGIACDSTITARHGAARIWTRQLYNTLLQNLSPRNTIAEARLWYDIYSREAAVIAESTKRDYNAQKGRAEAEEAAKRSLILACLILAVCATVIVLLYFLNRQNRKLKRARSALALRNEELEENRSDLESLVGIGQHVVSTLEIDDDSHKTDFVNGIYREIRQLNILAALPDLSFILYIHNDDGLQRFCKESDEAAVDISLHPMTDLHRPAVGCFVNCGREVLSFGDWQTEYLDYARIMGIDPARINPDRQISGYPTRSLAFLNLYDKTGEKIGVLSFQTTEPRAFERPSLLTSFEIIAGYVAAALDNAMQYQELRFVQKKLIEQKRMELLTYVVRGISHELSQPLGSITQTLYDTFKDVDRLGAGQTALSGDEYDATVKNVRADLVTIAQSKDAISDLVNSFRNTIRENIIDPEAEFNLSQKLDDIVKVLRPNIKSNINLEVDCPPELAIRSFPLLFSQVVTNLVSNANQHAFPDSESPGDTVRIVCRAAGKNLILQCIDNGIGIPENELDKLCQPFVSKKQSNLGLGLSLVKNIVEQYMRGEISFSSHQGLTATVVMPGCVIPS